jgi:hypothetical protein
LCGLDLRAVDESAYGEHCWQRDQLGIVDDRCPAASVVQGKPTEAGCCAEDGQCGTVNVDQALGCRHAQGSAIRACDEQPATATCDPTGSFGFRITIDASWGGRTSGLAALTDDGRGPIQVYLLAKVDGVDATTNALNASGRVCGVTFPAFYSSSLCESYQPIFPNTIWESSKVPLPDMQGRYECSAQGCVLSIAPATYLLGFEMQNPETPWPSADDTTSWTCASGKGAQCFPDHDDDGEPGVQVNLLTSGTATGGRSCGGRYPYRAAPLSASLAVIVGGVRRTDRLQLGTRIKLGSSVRIADDCSTGKGSAVAEYVNSRAIGCLVEQGSYDLVQTLPAGSHEACTDREANFLDENLPEYLLLNAGQTPASSLQLDDKSASDGPSVSVVRFGATNMDVSCADVRAAKF